MATKKLKNESGTKPEETAARDVAPAIKTLPIKTLRVEDCSASIWARDVMIRGQARTYFSVSFERSYKDRNGTFRYTRSFDPESLGKLVSLCHQASEAIRALADSANAYHQQDAGN